MSDNISHVQMYEYVHCAHHWLLQLEGPQSPKLYTNVMAQVLCSIPVLTFTVPMQQYPQSPDVTGQTQPPVYHQDPNAAQYQQQAYSQQFPQQQPQHVQPSQPQHAQPSQPQGSFEQQQKAYPHPQQPGMPPQQQSGPVYQNATPIASLGRGPAPADCPACGQRSMTNVAFETGFTTQ